MTFTTVEVAPSAELKAVSENVLGALAVCEGILRLNRSAILRRHELYMAEFEVAVDENFFIDDGPLRDGRVKIDGEDAIADALERMCEILHELEPDCELP